MEPGTLPYPSIMSAKENHEENQALISAASRGFIEPARGTAVVRAENVHISGGSLTSAGRDVHNHIHFHQAPKTETPKVDLMAALESIDNFRGIQQDTLSKATPDTGKWVFDNDVFPRWRDPKSDVKTMWGSGMPGAGKTVLTSIVIDGVEKSVGAQDSTVCVAYIYIRYDEKAGLTVRYYLEVLVKQTVEKHPDCHQLAERVYAEHLRLKTRPTEDELLRLLKGFTTMVKAFYFLDALDEAPPDIQIDLVEKLLSTAAKLFITSRPSKAMEEHFPDAHHFTITAQESDLDLLINNKLNRSRELCKVLERGGATLRTEIVASIKQKCGGMFLHASLQLAALQHCTTVYEVTETLASFPPKIEDVYRHTWKRIINQATNKGVRAQNCIIWVLNAPKSMTVSELQHAAAVCLETQKFDPDRIVHIDTLIALCCGLLVVDEETTLVRLVHYTAKETLECLILETFPHLHSLMAVLCINRLIHHGFQDWKGKHRQAFDRVMGADLLLPYAYYAWSRHAQNSLHDPSTATKVKEFVRGCRSFPVADEVIWIPELLGPLHVVAFFNLPISMAGSHLTNTLNPNSRTTEWKLTPLHLACMRSSNFSTLRELLSLRLIDVNAVKAWGETSLMCAVEAGNEGAVKLLLAHPRIRLDPVDTFGWTAFTKAAWKGNTTVVRLILAHSPGMIHSTDGDGRTALSRACHAGHFVMVKLLLSYSQSEVRLADDSGRTPLSWAASSKSIDTLKLIRSLAEDDVHLADKEGRTPLSWASSDGGEDEVKILLASPLINVNLADVRGWTPLIWASKSEVDRHDAGTTKVLLAHPQISVNLQDHQGQTALIRAARRTNPEEVKLLLTHPDIEANLPDREGRTPLIWATMKRHAFVSEERVAQALVAHHQINVNLANNEGRTALSWAAQRGNESVVKLLLEHPQIGASHRPDNQGWTPLGWASKEGHNKIAELLLAHSPIQPKPKPKPEPEPEPEPQLQLDRGPSGMLGSAVRKVHRLWRK